MFAVTLAMVLALNCVDIARATEPEDAVQETEAVAAVRGVFVDELATLPHQNADRLFGLS